MKKNIDPEVAIRAYSAKELVKMKQKFLDGKKIPFSFIRVQMELDRRLKIYKNLY